MTEKTESAKSAYITGPAAMIASRTDFVCGRSGRLPALTVCASRGVMPKGGGNNIRRRIATQIQRFTQMRHLELGVEYGKCGPAESRDRAQRNCGGRASDSARH